MKYEIKVQTQEETESLAMRLGKLCGRNTVITLEGDLGAGKTTFTKGLAKALHINQTITSPTFTIIKEYHGDLDLYHMDVYRLVAEQEDLGFDDYFYGEGVTVIEWASKIKTQLPKDRLEIQIFVKDETSRLFEFNPIGKIYEEMCEVLFK